ncbi:LysR substrate-binding domain-containing protein [Pseudomonadales bacterium]|nr:LysR substrate-binding domain-containing protein [Pseudomonadales bacterium]MDG1938978.1 LysR substrate-binding domain-containing protein [Pseudomonadales bacterium]
MRNLSMDALRAVVATTDLGGVTAAADHLGRSQPAVSLQIQKLEETLNVEIFLRYNKQLKLSESGSRIYDTAKQILALNDQLTTQFIQPELAGEIRLGIPSEFATTLLPKILGRFSQAYPMVALEVFSDLSRNLLSESQRAKYDLILTLHDKPSARRKGLIKSDRLVWVGSKEHRYDRQEALPLILAQDGCLYRKRALRALDKIKQPWRIIHTNPDLSGIQAAIREGLGVTVLAESTVPEGLAIVDRFGKNDSLPDLGSIDISLLYERRGVTEVTERLAGYIQSSLN